MSKDEYSTDVLWECVCDGCTECHRRVHTSDVDQCPGCEQKRPKELSRPPVGMASKVLATGEKCKCGCRKSPEGHCPLCNESDFLKEKCRAYDEQLIRAEKELNELRHPAVIVDVDKDGTTTVKPVNTFLEAIFPILDNPTGPGWYWYQHPITNNDKVDPCCMEVGILNNDFRIEWKGACVGLEQLPGKWQRIPLSSFHEEKT